MDRGEALSGAHCERPQIQDGQLVDYLGRERASGVYQITQLLPPEGEAFQYRIKRQRTSRTRSQRKRTS
jgi:hypothetical protein